MTNNYRIEDATGTDQTRDISLETTSTAPLPAGYTRGKTYRHIGMAYRLNGGWGITFDNIADEVLKAEIKNALRGE